MGVLLCFLIVVFAGTTGEIAVTHTMKRIGEVHSFHPRAMLRMLGDAFRHRMMWIGIGMMALGFFCLLALLSWENVSLVVPATALSYAVGALGAKLFLGERVDRLRWLGVLLVVVGVALVWFG
jgi:drug/metabolite transporter (DMT)-like permease